MNQIEKEILDFLNGRRFTHMELKEAISRELKKRGSTIPDTYILGVAARHGWLQKSRDKWLIKDPNVLSPT